MTFFQSFLFIPMLLAISKTSVLSEPWLQSNSHHNSCPGGFTPFAKTMSCYKAIANPVHFPLARYICAYSRATLVSIHSAEENEFVGHLYRKSIEELNESEELAVDTSNEFLIGLVLVNGKWEYQDKSHFDYTNWDKGMPVNSTSDLRVVIETGLGQDKWKNIGLIEPRGFVCKKPMKKVETSFEEEIF